MMSLLACTNKGCYQQGEHKLDLQSKKVYCEHCNGEVDVSSYMKKILESSKQILKKAKQSAGVQCKSCKVSDDPVLLEKEQGKWVAACKHCRTEYDHLTRFFIQAMSLNKDVERIHLDRSNTSVPTSVKTNTKVAKSAKETKDNLKSKPVKAEKKTEVQASPKQKKPYQARLASDFLRQAGFKKLANELEP